jgi:tetratricopeptide (TPR) repeat protein
MILALLSVSDYTTGAWVYLLPIALVIVALGLVIRFTRKATPAAQYIIFTIFGLGCVAGLGFLLNQARHNLNWKAIPLIAILVFVLTKVFIIPLSSHFRKAERLFTQIAGTVDNQNWDQFDQQLPEVRAAIVKRADAYLTARLDAIEGQVCVLRSRFEQALPPLQSAFEYATGNRDFELAQASGATLIAALCGLHRIEDAAQIFDIIHPTLEPLEFAIALLPIARNVEDDCTRPNFYLAILDKMDSALDQSDNPRAAEFRPLFFVFRGIALVQKNDLAAAKDTFQSALQLGVGLPNQIPGLPALIHTELGKLALHRGDFTTARAHLEPAVQVFREIDEKEDIWESLAHLALVLLHENRNSEADTLAQEAVAAAPPQYQPHANEALARVRSHSTNCNQPASDFLFVPLGKGLQ